MIFREGTDICQEVGGDLYVVLHPSALLTKPQPIHILHLIRKVGSGVWLNTNDTRIQVSRTEAPGCARSLHGGNLAFNLLQPLVWSKVE